MDETSPDAVAIHGNDFVSIDGQAGPSAQNSQTGSMADAQGDQFCDMETISSFGPTDCFCLFHCLLEFNFCCISAQAILIGGGCMYMLLQWNLWWDK